jgi:mannose-6-phosphate isomerase
MLALSDFWLLHGFKSPEPLIQLLLETPELQFLLPIFDGHNYEALYEMVMMMPQQEANEHLQPLLDRIVPLYEKGFLDRSQEDFWAARAFKTFCEPNKIDRGIFSIYFFNLVHLQPGEAIFQDAGIPHAYLEGQNMELMANSDNVLRGGLTNKHIDVTELMHHVRFEKVSPNILTGNQAGVEGEVIFITPAADFELHYLNINKGKQAALTTTTADIFFVYKGAVNVIEGNNELSLTSGEAFLATAGAQFNVQAGQDSMLFHATVPNKY